MARDLILLRSPYFVNLESANITSIRIDLYIYTGTETVDKPVNPQYTLTSTTFTNSNSLKFAEIDISPYCRDYIDPTYDFTSTNPSNAVWIDYDLYYTSGNSNKLILEGSYELVGLDGYNYPYQGYNKLGASGVLMSGDTVEVPEGESTFIPVVRDNLDTYSYYAEATLSGGETPLQTVIFSEPVSESDNVIAYISTEPNTGTAKTIVFGFSGTIPDETIYIKYNPECRNDVTNISFVNRYGAIQTVSFFGKSETSLSTTQTTFKRNLLDGTGSYDIRGHQDRILSKNGKQSFSISSGFYKESSNYIFNELMLSERVWLEASNNNLFSSTRLVKELTVPVNVKNSSFVFKQHLYEKLINYTFQFEIAVDTVNNIR